MSKIQKIALGILSFSFIAWALYSILSGFGVLRLYTIPTTASSPAIEVGDRIAVSGLFIPKNNDFVVFNKIDSTYGESHIVSRMVAQAADTIDIRNGILFVNNKNIDYSLLLKHNYILPKTKVTGFRKITTINDNFMYPINNDIFMVQVENKIANRLDLKKHYNTQIISWSNNKFFNDIDGKNWTINNFGPYVIPEDHFFVLGDNRDNSNDSRFNGPIHYNDFIGKVINR